MWNSIQIVKVPGRISSVTPSSPPAKQEIGSATRGRLGIYYTLSAEFFEGFYEAGCGFGFGVPGVVLPVQLLSFTGQLMNDKIALRWKTTSEINSSHFEIEKSINGVSFTKIGRVDAQGNTSIAHSYDFDDQAVKTINYYRLKMVDKDGTFKYSNVLLIKATANAPEIWVKNPFTDNIIIGFSEIPTGKVRFALYSVKGELILSEQKNAASVMTIDASRLMAKGIYILKVWADRRQYSLQLMKK